MKITTLETNRYPSKEKSFLNLTVAPWLNERYKKVLKEGNPKRIAKYEGMTPLNLIVENPLVIMREAGYFRSTIVARKNGLCFPDPKIQFNTFENFLIQIDPNQDIYLNPNIPKELNKENLELMATVIDNFPKTPAYYVSKFSDGSFGLIVFSDIITLDLDDIFDKIFNGFDFEELKGDVLEKDDDGYPMHKQINGFGYVMGEINVSDILLKEVTCTIKIINIKLIKEILELREYYYNGKYKHNGSITYSGARNQ